MADGLSWKHCHFRYLGKGFLIISNTDLPFPNGVYCKNSETYTNHAIDEPLHNPGTIVALKKLRALKPFYFVKSQAIGGDQSIHKENTVKTCD